MNIYEYFNCQLGVKPADETFKKLPVDSPCGDDCKKAIDAAVTLIEADDNAGGRNCKVIRDIAFHACQVYWRG